MNTRRMFGEGSNCRMEQITDGTSTTIMLAESVFDIVNGRANAWGFRGWVMAGVDPGHSPINVWAWPTVPGERPGVLGSWGHMGSLHPSGAHAAFADGSVRFLNESLDTTILTQLAVIADGVVI